MDEDFGVANEVAGGGGWRLVLGSSALPETTSHSAGSFAFERGRTRARTRCPRSRRMGMRLVPMKPVPPVMKTRREADDLGKELTLSKSRMSEMDAGTALVRSWGSFWIATGIAVGTPVKKFNPWE